MSSSTTADGRSSTAWPPRYSADPRANFSWTSLPIPSPSTEKGDDGFRTPPEGHPATRTTYTPRRVSFLPEVTTDRPHPSRRYSELPGDMPSATNSPNISPSSSRTSPSPPPLSHRAHDQHTPWTIPPRSISPARSDVPPLPTALPPAHPPTKHIQVLPTPLPTGPNTPHRASERVSVNKLAPGSIPNTPRTSTQNMSEKPTKSSNLRLRSESGAPSFTSTIRPKSLAPTTAPNGGTFAQRVFDAAKSDLLYDLNESTRMPWHFKDYKHGVLDLTTLQRMQQHVLQAKLVEQVKALGDRGMWMEIGIGETMKEYCQVARDMEYMSHTALRGTSADPFLITTTNALESLLLEEGRLVAPRSHPSSPPPSSAGSESGLLTTPRLPYMQRISPARRRLRRFLAIFAAAMALLVPYLIATLVPGQLARLIMTCVLVALFAAVCAASEMSNARAAGVTLAYAAALIVFVGVGPPHYFN